MTRANVSPLAQTVSISDGRHATHKKDCTCCFCLTPAFVNCPDDVPGLELVKDFISGEEEEDLLKAIGEADWIVNQKGNLFF